MRCMWIVFVLGLSWGVSGLILPMSKTDGSVDMSSVVSHITLLEQMVSDFQKKTIQLEIDLQVTKSGLQKTMADLKDQQQRSDAEISSLKAVVTMTSDELTSTKTEVASLKTKFLSLQASTNQTVLDSISHDVKSNMADIKSVKHALEITNSSLETCVTQCSNSNRNATAATIELQRQQKESKSEISNISSTLAQFQSNVTFTFRDFYRVKDSVTAVQTQLISTTIDVNLIKSEVASISRNLSDLEVATQCGTQIPQMSATSTFATTTPSTTTTTVKSTITAKAATTIKTATVPVTTAAQTTTTTVLLEPAMQCLVCKDNNTCNIHTCAPGEMCMTTVTDTVRGQRTFTKSCGTKDTCFSKWWQETSDRDTCLYVDRAVYNFDQTCYFCCTRDRCNVDGTKLRPSDLYSP